MMVRPFRIIFSIGRMVRGHFAHLVPHAMVQMEHMVLEVRSGIE